MAKTTILVTGATGKQGGAAFRALLDAAPKSDVDLRFLTRNPASDAAQSLVNLGAQAVKGNLLPASADDATDPALEQALKGVDRAFLVTDFAAGERETEQGARFIDAAKAAGVEHVVYTSVCGAERAKDVPHFRSKNKVEEHLKASGLAYTILRPVWFMDNYPTAPGLARFFAVGASYAMFGFKTMPMIAVSDIGAVAAKALLSPTDPAYRNTSIDLAAGSYTIEDVRRAFAQAQGGGEPWFATYVPKMARLALPLDMKMMMIFFENEGYPDIDVDKVKKLHPGLLSLQQWIEKQSASA